MTGAKIKIENGLIIPPVKKSKTPSCKVSNNKNVNFTYDENGMHNESSWATALLKIFLNL